MSPQKKNSQVVSKGGIISGARGFEPLAGSPRMAGDITSDAPPPEVLTETSNMFLDIKSQVDKREEDDEIDKDELKDILDKIQREINKGDSANPAKLERWLGNLSSAVPDVFEVTATRLLEPIFHLPRFVRLIIQKAKKGIRYIPENKGTS